MSTLLPGLQAKLNRTDPQIRQLALLIETFFRYWPVGQVCNYDPDRDEDVWSFAIGSPILPDIPVVIGEVLHNIRSPLDLVVSAIAKKATGSHKGTHFPFGADAVSFEEQARQKCKRLPAEAVDRIRAWKPYRGGNELLWLAHDLNREDKHNDLTPVNLSTGVNQATYLTVWSGLVLVIGHRNAQHLVVERRSPEDIAQMGSPTAVYSVPPGTQLTFSTHGCSPRESLEFIRATPGATFTTDMRPAMDIAFAGNPRGPLEPVCSTLSLMAGEVRRVISDLSIFL